MEFSKFDLPLDLFPHRPAGVDPVRSPGIHLTQITRDIYNTSGGNAKEGWDERSLWLAGEVGFMWEDLLSQCLKSRLPDRIGEIEKDGILMSPDGFDIPNWELWEYKATWRSCNKLPYDNWLWMAQVKAYALAMGTTVVKMAVLYIMGDWRGTGPQYQGFRLEFSDYELCENWTLLVEHGRRKGWIS